ncbi:MAG: hypothetical protein ACKVH0_00725, partial [Alphaproteobacteria bacterium]
MPDSKAEAFLYERFVRTLQSDLDAYRSDLRDIDWRAVLLGRAPATSAIGDVALAPGRRLHLLPLSHPLPDDRAEAASDRIFDRTFDDVPVTGEDRRNEAWSLYKRALGCGNEHDDRAIDDALLALNTEPLFLGQMALLSLGDGERLARASSKAALFHELFDVYWDRVQAVGSQRERERFRSREDFELCFELLAAAAWRNGDIRRLAVEDIRPALRAEGDSRGYADRFLNQDGDGEFRERMPDFLTAFF